MFKNEFQGGAFLEVLNIQGKDLNSKCKVLGASITGGCRLFDKSIKSHILMLEGESTRTKIVIPKDTKQTLYILQPFLVIQLCVAAGVSFSLEVIISDSTNQKRRILLSTSYKDISVTSFHVKIPLRTMKRGTWLNFCLDLKSIVEDCFKGQGFKTIDSIIICANCKLRKVFTIRSQPKDDFVNDFELHGRDEAIYEEIPRALQMTASPDVKYGTQVINMESLRAADIKFRIGSGKASLSNSTNEGSRSDRSQRTHIAFGSRVAVPNNPFKGGSTVASNLERQTSNISLSSNKTPNLSSSHVDLNGSSSSVPQIEGQKPVLQPRPPKPASGKASRRPNPRVRSAERVVKRAKLKSSHDDYDDYDDDRFTVGKNDDEMENSTDEAFQDASRDKLRDSNGGKTEDVQRKMDRLNNNEVDNEPKKVSSLRSVSEKLVGMRMGSQEDEEEYFRKRHDSESQEESLRSKDGSFSSTAGSEPFFLYSSKPHSVMHPSKPRRNSESTTKNALQSEDNEKEAISEKEDTVGISITASLESDFHRESSDSDTEDPIKRVHRLNGIRKNMLSPACLENPGENAKIRSSLLKEISPPSKYDHLKYQSVQSDSMSWMYDSDASQAIPYNAIDDDHQLPKDKLSPRRVRNDVSPRNNRMRVIHGLSLEANEVGSDSEDILSDASDETSYSTWREPPPHIRNYRYQDEMHGVGMTLDLSATLPMTPYIEEGSPIKDGVIINSDSGISLQGSERMELPRVNKASNEVELDLLYDPVLNCYYDPKSRKYYELA